MEQKPLSEAKSRLAVQEFPYPMEPIVPLLRSKQTIPEPYSMPNEFSPQFPF